MPDANEDSGVDPQDGAKEGGKEENIQPVKNPEAIKLQNDIKESIKGKQEKGEIRTRVVDALVEEEVTVRADLLTKVLAKRKAQQKELDKIKPDHCTFHGDGTAADLLWSKAKLKEKQEAEKKLNKIDKAINAAINDADYEGVKKFAQG